MAATSIISPFELARVANRAYEGKDAIVLLCSLGAEGFDENSLLSDWRSIEVGGFGYAPVANTLQTGAYDAVDGEHELPFFDSTYTAVGGPITWNTAIVYIDDPVLQSETVTATDISFNTATDKIVRTAGDFTVDYTAGEYVSVTGSANSNDGVYEITNVTTLELTIDATFNPLANNESAGASVTLTRALIYPYTVITETPSLTLADGQTHTYRITLNTNDA